MTQPVPQSWVPRVTNAAVGLVVLVLCSPVVVTWGDLSWLQRVSLLLVILPALLVAALCLTSAARPGSLGRAARRARARRQARDG